MSRENVVKEFDYLCKDGVTRHFNVVYDTDYQPGRSGDPDHEEEDYQNECKKLDSGEWIVVGCIVTEPCTGLAFKHGDAYFGNLHCKCCMKNGGMTEEDSLWGIVLNEEEQQHMKKSILGIIGVNIEGVEVIE